MRRQAALHHHPPTRRAKSKPLQVLSPLLVAPIYSRNREGLADAPGLRMEQTVGRIRRLNIYHFQHKLSVPVRSTMGPVDSRPAIILRVEDSDGAVGFGEIWCNFPPDGDLHRARLASRVLPTLLADLGSANIDRPFNVFTGKLRKLSLQSGEPGPIAQIAAGADLALFDLLARRAGQPLVEYLGGTVRSVDAYASGISPDTFESQFERMRGLGYRHFKQRIGFGRDDSLPEAEAAASALQPGETLRVDANQAWDLETAIRQADRLADMAPAWLEEPLPADTSWDNWCKLASATGIPLAAGENLRRQEHFDLMINSGAITVVQPDVCKWGGISGCQSVARNALEAGHTYCPHFLGAGVGLLASAHLLAAVGGDGMLEVDSSENPLMDLLSPGGAQLVEGRFALPSGPGLGFEPDLIGARPMLVSEVEHLVLGN